MLRESRRHPGPAAESRDGFLVASASRVIAMATKRYFGLTGASERFVRERSAFPALASAASRRVWPSEWMGRLGVRWVARGHDPPDGSRS